MSEHTPGPWAAEKVNERKIRQWSIRAQGAEPVISYELATLSGHDPVRDKANASLMAAAPEQLAACRSAVLALAALQPTCPTLIREYEIVSAAIAKATQY